MKDARERAEKIATCNHTSRRGLCDECLIQALEDAYRAGMLRAAEICEDRSRSAYHVGADMAAQAYDDCLADIRAEAAKGERG